jgi:hypothetical protein
MLTDNDDAVVRAVLERLYNHDQRMGCNWTATRNGLRLGLAALEDETAEALAAWRDDRRRDGWAETRDEVLDVAAVAFRLLRALVNPGEGGDQHRQNPAQQPQGHQVHPS